MPRVTIVAATEDEAEASDFLVCALASQPARFTDNEFAECFKCGCAIQHRPNVPSTPKKICMNCMPTDGKIQVMVTPTTAAEVAAYHKKKMMN